MSDGQLYLRPRVAAIPPNMSLEGGQNLVEMRVFAHPVRLRMLSRLSGRALSAAELGRELGISQASASYHLRKLAAAGFIDLADERVVHGGRERRYRYDPHPQRSIEPASRRDFVFTTAAEIRWRIEQADHTQPASGWDAELWVDPQVWSETVMRVREVMVGLHEQAHAPDSEGTIPVSATTILFGLDREDAVP